MFNLLVAFGLSLISIFHAFAEDVPPPANQNTRHYLTIPEGGLATFLKRPAFPLPLVSHHRAGPVPGFPENAIETMDNALKYGYGFMEVDVAQLKDGTLILMHDDTLGRTTNGTGALRNKTWNDIQNLYLIDNNGQQTSFRIPRLKEVLLWAKGKAILTLDIKRGVNFKKVADMVIETGTQDYAAAIAYSIDQAKVFHQLAPNMPMSIGLGTDADIASFDNSGIPDQLVIAWTGTKLLPASHYQKLHARGWRVIVGTLGNSPNSIDNQILNTKSVYSYTDIVKRGADVIATDRFWAVQQEVGNPNILVYSKPSIAIQPN